MQSFVNAMESFRRPLGSLVVPALVGLLLSASGSRAQEWSSPLLGLTRVTVDKQLSHPTPEELGRGAAFAPLPPNVVSLLGDEAVDYESFVVTHLPPGGAAALQAALTAEGFSFSVGERPEIRLPGTSPSQPSRIGDPMVAAILAPRAVPGLWLVQFAYPIKEEWRQSLSRCGFEEIAYFQDATFLVRTRDTQAPAFATCEVAPYLAWAGPYLTTDRISRDLVGFGGEGSVSARSLHSKKNPAQPIAAGLLTRKEYLVRKPNCAQLGLFIVSALVGAVAAEAEAFRPPTPPAPGPAAYVVPAAGSTSGDVQRVKIGDDLWVEKLHGEAALAHLYNLLGRRPDALAAARRNLTVQGFSPTETVYVERVIGLAHGSAQESGSSVGLAQTYSEQDGRGEIVFWSWDDGQPNTWEGTIYIEIYSNGAASTWEGQINSGTTDHPWVYYRKTWEQQPRPPQQTLWDAPPLPGTVVPATMKTPFNGSPDEIMLAGTFYGWAKCWRQCVVGWCAGAAVACLGTTVNWPICWGAACSGAELACGINCYGS